MLPKFLNPYLTSPWVYQPPEGLPPSQASIMDNENQQSDNPGFDLTQNYKSSLIQLIQNFPNIPEGDIKSVFESCNHNFTQTVNFLQENACLKKRRYTITLETEHKEPIFVNKRDGICYKYREMKVLNTLEIDASQSRSAESYPHFFAFHLEVTRNNAQLDDVNTENINTDPQTRGRKENLSSELINEENLSANSTSGNETFCTLSQKDDGSVRTVEWYIESPRSKTLYPIDSATYIDQNGARTIKNVCAKQCNDKNICGLDLQIESENVNTNRMRNDTQTNFSESRENMNTENMNHRFNQRFGINISQNKPGSNRCDATTNQSVQNSAYRKSVKNQAFYKKTSSENLNHIFSQHIDRNLGQGILEGNRHVANTNRDDRSNAYRKNINNGHFSKNPRLGNSNQEKLKGNIYFGYNPQNDQDIFYKESIDNRHFYQSTTSEHSQHTFNQHFDVNTGQDKPERNGCVDYVNQNDHTYVNGLNNKQILENLTEQRFWNEFDKLKDVSTAINNNAIRQNDSYEFIFVTGLTEPTNDPHGLNKDESEQFFNSNVNQQNLKIQTADLIRETRNVNQNGLNDEAVYEELDYIDLDIDHNNINEQSSADDVVFTADNERDVLKQTSTNEVICKQTTHTGLLNGSGDFSDDKIEQIIFGEHEIEVSCNVSIENLEFTNDKTGNGPDDVENFEPDINQNNAINGEPTTENTSNKNTNKQQLSSANEETRTTNSNDTTAKKRFFKENRPQKRKLYLKNCCNFTNKAAKRSLKNNQKMLKLKSFKAPLVDSKNYNSEPLFKKHSYLTTTKPTCEVEILPKPNVSQWQQSFEIPSSGKDQQKDNIQGIRASSDTSIVRNRQEESTIIVSKTNKTSELVVNHNMKSEKSTCETLVTGKNKTQKKLARNLVCNISYIPCNVGKKTPDVRRVGSLPYNGSGVLPSASPAGGSVEETSCNDMKVYDFNESDNDNVPELQRPRRSSLARIGIIIKRERKGYSSALL